MGRSASGNGRCLVSQTTLQRSQPLEEFILQVRGQLIVSCQALPDEPLYGAEIMARMALAAQIGGAKAIRANTPPDIAAICAIVDLPIIGLYKDHIPGYEVYITPTLVHAMAVVEAGAHLVAIDATNRPRPQGGSLADFIAAIHEELTCPVLADVSNVDEGLAAEAAGADLVSTTLSGYTATSPDLPGPDLDLVRQLAGRLHVPLLAEGRYHTPQQVLQALDFGALAVIVGGAITRPQEITRRFVAALPRPG